MTDDDAERFWRLVDVRLPSECWLWLGGRTGRGNRYGCVERAETAHRRAWELSNGEPAGDRWHGNSCGISPLKTALRRDFKSETA